jgi:hypothetical protein
VSSNLVIRFSRNTLKRSGISGFFLGVAAVLLLSVCIVMLVSYRVSYAIVGNAMHAFFEARSDRSLLIFTIQTDAINTDHSSALWINSPAGQFGRQAQANGHIRTTLQLPGFQFSMGNSDPRILVSHSLASKFVFLYVSDFWIIGFLILSCGFLGWPQYVRGRRAWRISQGRCPQCGYDLRGSEKRCPECGKTAQEVGEK